jgi:hypothetical protein
MEAVVGRVSSCRRIDSSSSNCLVCVNNICWYLPLVQVCCIGRSVTVNILYQTSVLTHCYIDIVFHTSYLSVRCTSCDVIGIMYANREVRSPFMCSPWRRVFGLSPSEPLFGFSCAFVPEVLSPSKIWQWNKNLAVNGQLGLVQYL